ncbi:hypothetical protein QT196_00410 [Streptomyces sp. P9-2B-2]|nr:hypothetical protein [Streptomyces sp. P9-2B-2]WJY43140.1 hypothetical protein QT196_00410 [Streptomyces sp. P9-2B-2]
MATRYDQLAVRYEATVLVAAINEWVTTALADNAEDGVMRSARAM